jgi:hypothetical protein
MVHLSTFHLQPVTLQVILTAGLRIADMIKSFKHNGLKRLFTKGERRRVSPEHADKLERMLDRLDASLVAILRDTGALAFPETGE